MSITVCSFIKQENNYIDEWLKHHIDIGVDKFIIYDNNDGRIDYPMTEYVSQQVLLKKVKIIYKRNELLNKEVEYKTLYKLCETDWMMFLDIDEFLILKNNININDWLSQEKFNNTYNILISQKCFDDNNIIYSDDNHLVRKKFKFYTYNNTRYNKYLKAIIKTHLQDIKCISDKGVIATSNILTKYCNGNIYKVGFTKPINDDFSEIEVDVYPTKSLEEYCKIKIARNNKYDKEKIKEYKEKYFEVNKYTIEKDQLFDYFIQTIYEEERERMHSYAIINFGNG